MTSQSFEQCMYSHGTHSWHEMSVCAKCRLRVIHQECHASRKNLSFLSLGEIKTKFASYATCMNLISDAVLEGIIHEGILALCLAGRRLISSTNRWSLQRPVHYDCFHTGLYSSCAALKSRAAYRKQPAHQALMEQRLGKMETSKNRP